MNKHLWNSDTSWGCVPAAATTTTTTTTPAPRRPRPTLALTTLTTLAHLTTILLLLLLAPGPGGALDPGIDLLDALSLHTNLSQYQGVTVTDEYQHQRVYHLSGGDRNLVLPTSVFHRAVDQMKRTADFTFAVVLKQEQANSGTIVSFSNGNNRITIKWKT